MMLPSNGLIMDEDDIYGMIGADGNVFQGLTNWPYISNNNNSDRKDDDNDNNNEQKIQQQVQTDIVDADITKQLESNVEILDKIDSLIEAKGDQEKISSFLTGIQHVQRISAQQMLFSQNKYRMMDDFKHKAILLAECDQIIEELMNSESNQSSIIQHVELILSSASSLFELDQLNEVTSAHAKSIDDAVNAVLQVCVSLYIYIYKYIHVMV